MCFRQKALGVTGLNKKKKIGDRKIKTIIIELGYCKILLFFSVSQINLTQISN